MIRRAIWSGLFVLLWAAHAMAQDIPVQQARLFLEFARDASGDDAGIMAQAARLIDTPPTTLETIGFYGFEGAPAPERTLRGIISVLGDAGHILEFEDKYINEMPLVLEQQGLADFDGDPIKDVLTLFGDEIPHDRPPTDEHWQRFRAGFPAHVRAVEAAVQRRGHEMLSLNLPLGDTMHVWIAPPEIAAKWRNQMLYAGVNTLADARIPVVTVTLTEPAWDDYWRFLTYAIHIPKAYWPVPDYE